MSNYLPLCEYEYFLELYALTDNLAEYNNMFSILRLLSSFLHINISSFTALIFETDYEAV